MKIHNYYVYVLTNQRHTVLHTGVTNDLARRCYEHILGQVPGFTKKYNVHKLIYFEVFDEINLAIAREKQLKGITRQKKEALINGFNPIWQELYNNGVIILPPEK